MFRNLTMYVFPRGFDFGNLHERLAEHALQPVPATALASSGFVPPLGQAAGDTPQLAHTVNGAIWIAHGTETRMLPAAVVARELTERLNTYKQQHGNPGANERKKIKEALIAELLPRAFVHPRRTDAILDTQLGVMLVDTGSRKTAEAVLTQLRTALGSFPVLPINAEIAPRMVMTGWLAGDALPNGLELGDECLLRDPVDKSAVVRVSNIALDGDEIQACLETGMQAERLALMLGAHASFVLGDDLVLRKFRLLDAAIEQLEDTDCDSMAAELDARFALMVGEFRRVFAVLQRALKISRMEG